MDEKFGQVFKISKKGLRMLRKNNYHYQHCVNIFTKAWKITQGGSSYPVCCLLRRNKWKMI